MSRHASSNEPYARVGMVLYGDLAYDGRVRREAGTLQSAGYQVTLVCINGTDGTPDLPAGVEVIVRRPVATSVLPGASKPDGNRTCGRLSGFVRQGRWLADYARNVRSWGRSAIEACGLVDVWHAHDLPSLAAIAPVLSSGVPVIYDSHELFLEFGSASRLPGVIRMLLRIYERHLVSKVAAVVTVNHSLAMVLQERYAPEQLVVVHNVPPTWHPPGRWPERLGQALGLDPSVPIVLYHGGFARDRGLLHLANAMLAPGLERVHLAYLGFGVYTDELVALSRMPQYGGRIHVLPAVPVEDLPEWVASSDVGVMPNQPTSANDRLSTPNKLFQSLAVGVPVVTSDFPERRRIVIDDAQGPLGATCDPADPMSIGRAIRQIIDLDPAAQADLRRRCLKAAHERWNWEAEGEKLIALYSGLVSLRRRRLTIEEHDDREVPPELSTNRSD